MLIPFITLLRYFALRCTYHKVAGLQAQLREVVATRAAVELAVRGVLAENERLAAEVDALTARLEACGVQSSTASAAAGRNGSLFP